VSQITLAELSWSRLAILPVVAKAPKFVLVRESLDEAANEATDGDFEAVRGQLAELPRTEAISFAEQLLIKHVASIVGITPARLAADQSLLDLGMDSLMLVELQMKLEKQCGIVISTLELMDTTTVAKLAQRIVDHVGTAPAMTATLTATDPVADPDQLEPPAEPGFVAALGRLLEDDLDRAKERAL
jgi:phthiocerol/phenolphthiocerol synthesis type-I polyketide synthase C